MGLPPSSPHRAPKPRSLWLRFVPRPRHSPASHRQGHPKFWLSPPPPKPAAWGHADPSPPGHSRITSGSSRGGRAPAPNSPRALSIPKRCRAPRTGWILHRGCLFGRFMCQPSAAPHPFSSSASQPRARRSFSRLLQSFWDRSHAEPAGCRSCRSHGWSTAHKPQPYTQQGSSPASQGGKRGPCSSPFAPRIQYNLCLFPFFPVCTFPIAAGGCPRNAERSPWQPPELPNNSPMSARIATAGTAAPRAHASGSTFPKNLRSTPSSKAPVGNRRAGGDTKGPGEGGFRVGKSSEMQILAVLPKARGDRERAGAPGPLRGATATSPPSVPRFGASEGLAGV